MNATRFLLIVSCFSTLGCDSSIHPHYTPDTLTHEPNLIGTWVEADSRIWGPAKNPQVITVTREGSGYNISTTQNEETLTFSGHLTKIGEHLYLDLLPQPAQNLRSSSELNVIRTHSLCQIEVTADTLQVFGSVMDQLDKQAYVRESLDHVRLEDGRIILVGSTEEVRDFVANNANELIEDRQPKVYHRRR